MTQPGQCTLQQTTGKHRNNGWTEPPYCTHYTLYTLPQKLRVPDSDELRHERDQQEYAQGSGAEFEAIGGV